MRCIHEFSLGQNAHAQPPIQVPPLHDIDPPPLQQRRQLVFERDEIEPRNVLRLKLHQHIDITVRPEVIAQH